MSATDDVVERLKEALSRDSDVDGYFPVIAVALDEITRLRRSTPVDRNAVIEECAKAADNYIRCTQDPGLSPYIRENGRYGTKSPWRELVDAVEALRSLTIPSPVPSPGGDNED